MAPNKKPPDAVDSARAMRACCQLGVKPELLFYLWGVDVLKTDRLGRLSMTIAGCKKRDEIVLSFCKENNIPVQCSMGGGYSREIKTIIEAHANTFRIAKEIFT